MTIAIIVYILGILFTFIVLMWTQILSGCITIYDTLGILFLSLMFPITCIMAVVLMFDSIDFDGVIWRRK